ncbi:hypothetical protein NITLEN_80152 [Nitrospira lenta]|uniref:Transmembrane protein n=1 Tax=Nitrospira lenta TaxID=1436998 RepID=A0A330LBP1_9BACT|nr:hypothetical protein NITLEN_80152 [Nitrospira lenta]
MLRLLTPLWWFLNWIILGVTLGGAAGFVGLLVLSILGVMKSCETCGGPELVIASGVLMGGLIGVLGGMRAAVVIYRKHNSDQLSK